MDLRQILTQPIPDYTSARTQKIGYREHPLLSSGSRNSEPLVSVTEYGLAGQSYYSRPNSATTHPVEGVDSRVWVRQRVAEMLADINYGLQNSELVADILGGAVELYIDEGYRSPELQASLYETVFPALIRKQNPKFTDQQMLVLRDEMIAKPAILGDSPSPHATGAAVDVRLRYKSPDTGYVAGNEIAMGHARANRLAQPDYYEHTKPKNLQLQTNRRVFYWIMRGALLGDDSGFVVNPTEYWHWSYGDQMWAQLRHAPEAFYSFAK